MMSTFAAAWVPYEPTREFDTAAAIAMEWADSQAADRGHPAVLVTDRKGEYHGRPLFDSYRNGRHATPRSPNIAVRPGAVVAHVPTPEALALASRLAAGNALVVVEHPAPWRLAGWASAVGARDLVTGQVASLDPRLSERLQELVWYGNNGYARGYGRDNAQRVLNQMRADGLLDRDVVVTALGTFGTSPEAQEILVKLIDRM